MRSIFETPQQDRFFILMPPVLALLVAFAFIENSAGYLWLLLGVSVFDSGHVYITGWRTWWNAGLAQKPAAFYLVPALVFIAMFFWNYLSIPFLWTFVVYFTVYHNVRQLYGIGKWFQVVEKNFNKAADYFLYAVCAVSFLALHFRTDFKYDYYTGHDLFSYPNQPLFLSLQIVALLLFVLYLSYEYFLYKKSGEVFLNRVLFYASGMAVYLASCLWATNALQLLAPLILTHALHYLALVVLTGGKTNPWLKTGLFKVTGVVLGSLLLFGLLEYYLEEEYIDIFSHSIIGSIVVALYLVPLLTHFILDSIIWKSSYPEFRDFLKSKHG